MPDKFNNKYRIPPARAQWWDYSNEGAYFITICTKAMACVFGNVEDGVMNLNEIGKITYCEWQKTVELRPDMNLELGEFVVMPNHFHAVIFIGQNKYNTDIENVQNKFGTQSANLASIVRGFKAAVTRQAKLLNPEFSWQASYHDHIIRTAESFNNVTNYIRCNPEKWQEDRFYR
jgi:putative transposase